MTSDTSFSTTSQLFNQIEVGKDLHCMIGRLGHDLKRLVRIREPLSNFENTQQMAAARCYVEHFGFSA